MNSNNILTRPKEDTQFFIEDGFYNGVTKKAVIEIKDNSYSNTKRYVLKVTVDVIDEENCKVPLFAWFNVDWRPNSRFFKLLKDFAILPEKGEELDMKKLEGLAVRVQVKNKEKNGYNYSNVASIKKQ